MKTSFLYSDARPLAIALGRHLLPHCQKLNIAGSIRREVLRVSDIELICLPALRTVPGDLFSPLQDVIDPAFSQAISQLGTVLKGKPEGRYLRLVPHQPVPGSDEPVRPQLAGIELDLFIPQADDYIRQFVIRIGPASFSKRVAIAWGQLGWCGTEAGLRRKTDCQKRVSGGKPIWLCVNEQAEKPPVWASEREFFAWLQMPYVEPRFRA